MTMTSATAAEVATASPHDELDCETTELMLAELTASAEKSAEDAARAQAQVHRLTMLATELRTKLAEAGVVVDGQQANLTALLDEVDAVPDVSGAAVLATVSVDEVNAMYRETSGQTRGPIPPAVLAEVSARHEQIAEAMAAAGREAVAQIVEDVAASRA